MLDPLVGNNNDVTVLTVQQTQELSLAAVIVLPEEIERPLTHTNTEVAPAYKFIKVFTFLSFHTTTTNITSLLLGKFYGVPEVKKFLQVHCVTNDDISRELLPFIEADVLPLQQNLRRDNASSETANVLTVMGELASIQLGWEASIMKRMLRQGHSKDTAFCKLLLRGLHSLLQLPVFPEILLNFNFFFNRCF